MRRAKNPAKSKNQKKNIAKTKRKTQLRAVVTSAFALLDNPIKVLEKKFTAEWVNKCYNQIGKEMWLIDKQKTH